METRRIFALIIVILALGSLSAAGAERSRIGGPVEIGSGFVIVEGHYLPPPYLLQAEDGKTFVNGIEVSPPRNRSPFGARRFDARGTTQRPTTYGLERVKQHLRQDGMVVCASQGPTVFVPVEQAIAILDVLLADRPRDARLQSLLTVVPPWSARENWTLLVDTLDPPAELGDRVNALKKARSEPDLAEGRMERHWTVLSGLQMTGFALAVWTLGTLLSCRPPLQRGWRGVNPSRVCCRQVVWLVVLIVVLNVYDLLCTLLAANAGVLWELNPFAYRLIDDTALIVTFKIALTVGAASLLLLARRHRLAHIGSWWAGVLYTVLIIRWATFNSMFM